MFKLTDNLELIIKRQNFLIIIISKNKVKKLKTRIEIFFKLKKKKNKKLFNFYNSKGRKRVGVAVLSSYF